MLVSKIVTFMSKKKSSLWISQKSFKTTERHSLAVCGSLCGEKEFLLIFIPFHLFNQKQTELLPDFPGDPERNIIYSPELQQTNLNFLQDLPLSNMVRKTNFLSISELVSEIVTFMSKEKFSMNFPKNASKQQKSIV